MVEIVEELHQFVLGHLAQLGLDVEEQLLGGLVLHITMPGLEAVDELRDGRHDEAVDGVLAEPNRRAKRN